MSNQPVKLNVYEKARAQMLIKHPFFAAIVLSTEWVEVANDPRIPTAATDMVKVYYNPEFINDLSVDEAMFVMIHEIMHMILMHGLRRGSRKPRRWNHAGDYAINQELVDSGLTMPQMVLIDKARFSGLSAEQIYDLLEQDKKKKGKKGGKPGKPDPNNEPDPDDGRAASPASRARAAVILATMMMKIKAWMTCSKKPRRASRKLRSMRSRNRSNRR